MKISDLCEIERTPVALVDLDRVKSNLDLVRTSDPRLQVNYALKASYHFPVVEAMLDSRAGISVFSEMEMGMALRAGFEPADIIYNGVGRSGAELATAVAAGVVVNIESVAEMQGLVAHRDSSAVAGRVGVRMNIRAPLRVAGLEKYNILGVPPSELAHVADLAHRSGLVINGVSFHCLANQDDVSAHLEIVKWLFPELKGFGAHPAVLLEYVNVGGGLAARASATDDLVSSTLGALAGYLANTFGCSTTVELGRFLVGDAESLVTSVVDARTDENNCRVVIVDGTTNYLIPAPGHRFFGVGLKPPAAGERLELVRFVDRLGSTICENLCTPLAVGEMVRILNSGAYAGVMKEHFVFPLPDILFCSGGVVTASRSSASGGSIFSHHDWPEP